jgi:hypothetical protein
LTKQLPLPGDAKEEVLASIEAPVSGNGKPEEEAVFTFDGKARRK